MIISEEIQDELVEHKHKLCPFRMAGPVYGPNAFTSAEFVLENYACVSNLCGAFNKAQDVCGFSRIGQTHSHQNY